MPNPNHPKKGSTIFKEPIRTKEEIQAVKDLLWPNPRNSAFFTFGINTAYRAKELASVKVCQVAHLKEGDSLNLFQSKTKENRRTILNKPVIEAIQRLLDAHPYEPDHYLFYPLGDPHRPLPVDYISWLVKTWCKEAGLIGSYASHTMRKTWGHWQWKNGARIEILQKAYGHQSPACTMRYIGVLDQHIEALYSLEL